MIFVSDITALQKLVHSVMNFQSTLSSPGDGGDWVDQRHHEAKEEGALPFHKFLLEEIRDRH